MGSQVWVGDTVRWTVYRTQCHDRMAGLNGTAFCSSSLQEMDEEVEGDTLHLQPGMEEVRAEILGLSGFSGRLERVLLALLRKQATDRERMESNHTQLLANLEKERGEREKDKELVDRKLQELEEEQEKERKARKDIGDTLREQLEGIGKDLKADIEEMGRGVGVIEEKMKKQVGALQDCVRDLEDTCQEEKTMRENQGKQLEDALDKAKKDHENELEDVKNDVKNKVQDMKDAIEEQLMETKSELGDKLQKEQDKIMERIFDEEEKRQKETEMLRNGLEEEKLLRGQEQEMMKKTLADTVNDLGKQLDDHKGKVSKLVEDEKEERALQHDDMICRLDRERKDRIRGLDNITNQVHDDLEAMTTKQIRDAEEMRDAMEKEADARQGLRNDLEKEIIAQGKELFKEIDRNKNDIDTKLEQEILARSKNESDIKKKLEDSINMLTDNLEGSKDMMMAKIGNECDILKSQLDAEKEGLQQSMTDLQAKVEDNDDKIHSDLDKERKDRIAEQEAQANELSKEIDKNMKDITSKLESEEETRKQNEYSLKQELEAGLQKVADDLDASKDMILGKIGEECTILKNQLDSDKDGLMKNIANLTEKLEDTDDRMKNELEEERKGREADKATTYADFEQICRNIDDRVTGEKEKLWDKLKDNETKQEEQNAVFTAGLSDVTDSLDKERVTREADKAELLEQVEKH